MLLYTCSSRLSRSKYLHFDQILLRNYFRGWASHICVCPWVAKDFMGEDFMCMALIWSTKLTKTLQPRKFSAICYTFTLSLTLERMHMPTHPHTHTHTHTHTPIYSHACTLTHALTFPQTERDVSVRQRAIDLLYAMCDHTNAQTIVEELLHYLEKADYSIKETLVWCNSYTLIFAFCVWNW